MEEQLVTAVMILDLSVAFDTVDHDLLLEVLGKRFGVTDKAKQWYCNYINRGNSLSSLAKTNLNLDN